LIPPEYDVFDFDGMKNAISTTNVWYHDSKDLYAENRHKSVHSSLQAAYRADKENAVTVAPKLNYSAAAKKNLPMQAVDQCVSTNTFSNKQFEQENEPNSGFSLEDYGRALHRMGENSQAGAAEFAETLLREMIDKFATGKHSIRPDGACYNSVIHAYAECGKAEKAEGILRLMFDDYQDGNEKAEPNVRVYTNVLHAWRKAKAPNAPERCETILKEMYELSDKGILPSCKPDTFAVTVSQC
jgi:pentatricopeptide repeat protein